MTTSSLFRMKKREKEKKKRMRMRWWGEAKERVLMVLLRKGMIYERN